MNKQGLEKFYNTLGKKMIRDRWGLDVTFEIVELPGSFMIETRWEGPLIIKDPKAKDFSERYVNIYSDAIRPMVKRLNRLIGGFVNNKSLEVGKINTEQFKHSSVFAGKKVNDLNAWMKGDLDSFIKITGPEITRDMYVSKLSGILWIDNSEFGSQPIRPFENGMLLPDFLNFSEKYFTEKAKEEIIQTFG